jgi:hypothetical protein
VFLVFDSDLRRNRQVAQALYELSKELERRGARVQKIDLPEGPSATKVGLDDYLKTHSLETFCALEPSPVLPPEFQYIEIEPVTEFVKKVLPNREAIISNGILYPKSRIGITGPGKALKSMFTQNMILSIAAGYPMLGFDIPKARRVMYVQSEVSPHAMQDRFARMIAGRSDSHFAGAMLVNAHNLKIDTKEGFRTIQHLIERSHAEVLIFDPLYKLHCKDENSAQDMREIVDLFDRLIEEFGIAIGAVHHHGKTTEGRNDGQLARGSTIFGDWVDSQLVLRGTTEDRYQKRLSFILRNDAEPEPMQIVLDPETLWFHQATEQESNQNRQTEADMVLAAAQAIFNDGRDVDAKSLSLALGVAINTAKSRMKMLERFGWKEARGQWGKLVFRPEGHQNRFDTLNGGDTL